MIAEARAIAGNITDPPSAKRPANADFAWLARFDLPLGCGCVVQPFKMLMKHQGHRSPESHIAVVSTSLMLRHALLQATRSRADII
jgi:hypothetical protein